jgi:hypothetical protein
MTEIDQTILEMYKYLGTINSFIRKKCDQYIFKLRRKYTKTNYLEFDIFSLVLENLKKTKFVELDFTIKYNTIHFEISYINDKFSKNDIEILLDIFFQLTKELKVKNNKIDKKYVFKIIHIDNIYDYILPLIHYFTKFNYLPLESIHLTENKEYLKMIKRNGIRVFTNKEEQYNAIYNEDNIINFIVETNNNIGDIIFVIYLVEQKVLFNYYNFTQKIKHMKCNKEFLKKRGKTINSKRTTKRITDIPDYSIGLLMITVHGNIPIYSNSKNEIIIDIIDIPEQNVYYKLTTKCGFVSYRSRLEMSSDNSEYNEFVGDSYDSDMIDDLTLTLKHRRNVYEKCFKKHTLDFYNYFDNCLQNLNKEYLKKIKNDKNNKYFVRESNDESYELDRAMNQLEKGKKINKIINKNLSSNFDSDNKLIFVLYNTKNNKYERYNLFKFEDVNKLFSGIDDEIFINYKFKLESENTTLQEVIGLLSLLHLDYLYIYDDSCSSYILPEKFKTHPNINKIIDNIIDELPENIGR